MKYEVRINPEVLPESTAPDRVLRYIDIGNVDSFGRVLGVEEMRFEDAPSRARRIPRLGDSIIATVRTYLRAIAYISEDDPSMVCSTGFAVVRPGKRLDSKYLFYWLRSDPVVDEICARSVGVSYPAFNGPELGALPVPLVPLDQQRRIADFLDRKTASIDTLIEKQEQLLALLAEKRQALITQAVTKGLDPNVPMKDTGVAWFGQVPKHWEVSRIGYMAVVGNGSTPSREEARFWSEDENGYPWLNSARINDERIVRAERWVTCDALRECHLPKVPPGSVVVAITGEGQTRARAALLEIEATISQHLAYVRPRHGLNAVFLWRQLQAAYQWLRDQSAGGGSTRAALTCEFLRTVSIVVPPLAEQELIVSHIDSELRRIDSLSQRVQAMIERLCEYRQALITAAVTGQLDVTSGAVATSAPKPYAEAVGP